MVWSRYSHCALNQPAILTLHWMDKLLLSSGISFSHHWQSKRFLERWRAAPLSEHSWKRRIGVSEYRWEKRCWKKSKQNSWPWNSPFTLLAFSPTSYCCHCHQVYAAFKEPPMPKAPHCCRATGRPLCWFRLGRTKSDFSSDAVGPFKGLVCNIFEILRRNKWLHFEFLSCFTHLSSLEFASKLQWPAHTNLNTLFTFEHSF